MGARGIEKQHKEKLLYDLASFWIRKSQDVELEHYLFYHKSNPKVSEKDTEENTLNPKKTFDLILPHSNQSKAIQNKAHIGIHNLNISILYRTTFELQSKITPNK